MEHDNIANFISLIDSFISGYYNKHAAKIFEFISEGIAEEPFTKSLEQKLSSVSDSNTYNDFINSFTLRQIEQIWVEKIRSRYALEIAGPTEKLTELLNKETEKISSNRLLKDNDKNRMLEEIRQQYNKQTEHLASLFKKKFYIPEQDYQLLKEDRPFRALQFANFHFLPIDEHFSAVAGTVYRSLDTIYPSHLAIVITKRYANGISFSFSFEDAPAIVHDSLCRSKPLEQIKTESDLRDFLTGLYLFFKKAAGFYKELDVFETNHSTLSDFDFNSIVKIKEFLKGYGCKESVSKLFQLCLPTELVSHFDNEGRCTLNPNRDKEGKALEKDEVIFIKRESVDVFNLEGRLKEEFSDRYRLKFLRVLDTSDIKDGKLRACRISDDELIYPHSFARLRISESTNHNFVARTQLTEEQKIFTPIDTRGMMLFDRSAYAKFPIVPPVENKNRVLRIEVSDGCPHAGCLFCAEDRQYPFRVYSTDEIRAQKEKIISYTNGSASRIFLLGSDPLAIPRDRFIEILNEINKDVRWIKFNLPKRCYGTVSTISNLEEDYLKHLKELELGVIFIGLESGSENVLNYVHKHTLENQIYIAADKLRNAGIDVSLMMMPGLGEKKFNEEHTEKTIKAVNYFAPKYLTVLTRNPTKAYGSLIKNDEENVFLDKKGIIHQIYDMFSGFDYFDCKVTCANSKITPLAANPVIMPPFNMKDKFRIMVEFTRKLHSIKNEETLFLHGEANNEEMMRFEKDRQEPAVRLYEKTVNSH